MNGEEWRDLPTSLRLLFTALGAVAGSTALAVAVVIARQLI